jgi:SAM-dependent methyltransferase
MAGNYGADGRTFNRCGLAALSDLTTDEWKQIFARLEAIQNEFLAKEPEFRSPEYQWPRDALHNWSRVWEYAYAYDFLREWKADLGSAPAIADLGSGVTFFPFALSKLGYTVICTDTDPVCEKDLPRAAGALVDSSKVSFRLTNGDTLPFRDNEVDAIYCVSVLEHIPKFENTILEMARVLKPRGRLILTIDLDLNGKHEIGKERYLDLRSALGQSFELAAPEVTVHPTDQLTSTSGPYPLFTPEGAQRQWYELKQSIKPLLGRKPDPLLDYELCVAGFVLVKR